MTRIAVELPRHYPYKFVWFMECDKCQTTRSKPTWDQNDLPLAGFRLLGWNCGDIKDTCPECLAKEDAG